MEDYKKLYEDLIEMRRTNVLSKDDCYTELHHILPRSLGGSDDNDNLVRLKGSEHFIAHYYLAKMYEEGTKNWARMVKAFNMMNVFSDNQNRYENALLYEELKEKHSKAMSILMKDKSKGDKNSQFDTMWITNGIEVKKIPKNEEIPDGFVKGRVKNKKPKKKVTYKKKKKNTKRISLEENKALYEKLYNEFMSGYDVDTWDEFRTEFNIKVKTFIGFKDNMKKYYMDLEPYRLENKTYYNKNVYETKFNELSEYYTKLYEIRKKTTSSKFVEITGYNKKVSNLPIFFKKYVKGYK